MTKTQKFHSWMVLILMTLLMWAVVSICIVEISLTKFILVVILLGFSDYFCSFVDTRILKIKEVKPKDKQG